MNMKRITDYDKILPIIELYRCVQSEGSRFGRPTIAIRTTGCTHRCWFGEGGWCDSWYSSIHPEKGTFTFNDIILGTQLFYPSQIVFDASNNWTSIKEQLSAIETST